MGPLLHQIYFAFPSALVLPNHTLTMLAGNKRSKLAKELQHQGCTGFAKCATASSPYGSVYCLLGNNADRLSTDMGDRGDD